MRLKNIVIYAAWPAKVWLCAIAQLEIIILRIPAMTIDISSKAEKFGLARHLQKHKATPKIVQAKVKALLEDYELHARVKSMSKRLRSTGVPELAAKAIEDIS